MFKSLCLLAFIFISFNVCGYDTFYFDGKGNPQYFKVVEPVTANSWPIVTFYGGKPSRLNGTIGITFRNEIPLEKRKELFKKHSLNVIYHDLSDPDYYLLNMKKGVDPFQLSVNIYKTGFVKWAQPDMEAHLEIAGIDDDAMDDEDIIETMPDPVIPDDTWYTQYPVGKWHHEKIRSNYAWALEKGSPDIKIAIIDNGVDLEHEDLKENIVAGSGWNFVDENDNASFKPHTATTAYQSRIVLAHGTSVAGIAAAKGNNSKGVAGICWDCGIIPVRFLDMDIGTGYVDTFHKTYLALKHAVDQGASVINNSWVWWNQQSCAPVPFSSFVEQAVQYAAKNGRDGKGTIMVWAAGNNFCDTENVKNFDNDHIVVVSALRHNTLDNGKGYKSIYSNYGRRIDVSAPAGDPDDNPPYKGIVTCDISNGLGGDAGHYATNPAFSGTSAAAPVVSGAIALMLSAKPEMNIFEALHCLKKGAAAGVDKRILDGDMVDDHNIINKDRQIIGQCEWNDIKDPYFNVVMKHNTCFGYGYLDVYEMVKMAINDECTYELPLCTKDEDCPEDQLCNTDTGLCVLEIGCKSDEDCLTYQKCDIESGLCYFPENPDNGNETPDNNTEDPDNNTEIPDSNTTPDNGNKDDTSELPDETNEETDNISEQPDNNGIDEFIEDESVGCGCTLVY
jgi:subtilisin family serine protease